MREVGRRFKKSAKGHEAAKSKTANYGKYRGEDSLSAVWQRFHLPVGSSQLGS
jgi:hypothetical protein